MSSACWRFRASSRRNAIWRSRPLLGIVLSFGAYLTHGYASVAFVAALGFANAMMWPAIFPLAIAGLGRLTETGSALLIMGIAGGAVIPQTFAVLRAASRFPARVRRDHGAVLCVHPVLCDGADIALGLPPMIRHSSSAPCSVPLPLAGEGWGEGKLAKRLISNCSTPNALTRAARGLSRKRERRSGALR